MFSMEIYGILDTEFIKEKDYERKRMSRNKKKY